MNAGDLIAGKYRLTRPIGKGSMGAVWEATHEGTSRQVAVKLILEPTDELRHRLVREARAYGALRHRNIVDVLDVGETDAGDPFLVMQLLVGETLAERLTRQRRLPVAEAARIARDVARALATAHATSIIHRDLKPANIFLHDEPGEELTVIKVVDFGVSKNLLASDGLSTVVGGMVGSPAYMSPEQAGGGSNGPVDHRADVWSLGVVLFEMLTGVRPLQGDANTIIPQILSAEIPLVTRFVRTVDPAFAALVARCLDRDLTKRVGSAADLATQLQRFTTVGMGSGSSPLGQSSSAPSAPLSSPSRSEAAAIVSPRAPLTSAAERDPVARSPQSHNARLAPGPVMPGAGDDDDGMDEATAKLTPGVLLGMRPGVSPQPPQMSSLAGRTVPMQNEPASLPFETTAPVRGEAPPAAPNFKTTLPSKNDPTFGSGPSWIGPVPTTAKLEPNSAWDGDPQIAGHGTVRMPPETVDLLKNAAAGGALAAPPPAPPPPAAMSPSLASLSPLMQPSGGDPASASHSAALAQKRRRLSGIIAGSLVGVALAILVVVVASKGLHASPPAEAAATSASVPAVAPTPPSAPALDTAAPAAAEAPSAAPTNSAVSSGTVAPPKPPPVVNPVKRPSGAPTIPTKKPTKKHPDFLSP